MGVSPGGGAVQPGWIARRMPRGFCHRLLTRRLVPAEPDRLRGAVGRRASACLNSGQTRAETCSARPGRATPSFMVFFLP